MAESAAVKKRLTVPEKITAFFVERNNDPASFYQLMHLASIDALSRHVTAMLAAGKLLEVEGDNIVYLRLASD